MKLRSFNLLIIGLVFVALLSGCSPWVVPGQVTGDKWKTLTSSTSIGQTFVANYDGLQEVRLLLSPRSEPTGSLIFHLRDDPASSIDIATARLPLQEINRQQYYRFDFAGVKDSNKQYYYAFVEIDGPGSVELGYSQGEWYQNGSAYQDHLPIDGQLAFLLGFQPNLLYRGLFNELCSWIAYLLIGIILFTIPGWALLRLLWHGWNGLGFPEKIPISIGVSLAIYTLFVLYTYLVHIQLGIWYVLIPTLIGTFYIVLNNLHLASGIKSYIRIIKNKTTSIKEAETSIFPYLALFIILLMIFFSRFWAIRGIDVPMWNDSLHHTEITQLITDNQGLFSSWLPYAEYKTFSLHFGFPLAAALFSWISKTDSQLSVLIIGQIMSIFAALSLYPLTVRLTNGNRMGGVVAVLVAGLLSPMPAYYVNWGRYAQLAGQVLLPICIWMVWDVLDDTTKSQESTTWHKMPWIKIIITAGTITGMLLAEFRMIFVIFTLVITWLVGWILRYWKINKRACLNGLLSVIFIGTISIILFFPWAIRIKDSNLINYSAYNSSVDTLLNLVRTDYKAWQVVFYYVPVGIVIFGVFGWIWSLIKKDWITASLGLWVVTMAGLYSLVLFDIPWVHYVQSFAVIISLYIPVGILCGYFCSAVLTWAQKWKYSWILVFSVLIGLGIFGSWQQHDIAEPGTFALVTYPDNRAMEWINKNTPTDALFLVEGTHINWVTNIVGTDAGWWIPLLAHRENTMPPQYAISNETPIKPGYSLDLVNLIAELEKNSLVSTTGFKILCEYGISHVYIGQEQGSVGNPGKPLFTPAELETSSVFKQVYHQDRVYVYAVEADCDQ